MISIKNMLDIICTEAVACEWEDQPHSNWDVKILEKEYEERLYSEEGRRLLLEGEKMTVETELKNQLSELLQIAKARKDIEHEDVIACARTYAADEEFRQLAATLLYVLKHEFEEENV